MATSSNVFGTTTLCSPTILSNLFPPPLFDPLPCLHLLLLVLTSHLLIACDLPGLPPRIRFGMIRLPVLQATLKLNCPPLES